MNAHQTLVLDRMPAAGPAFFNAAMSGFRRPKGMPSLPALELKVGKVAVDTTRLSAYNQLCGFEDNGLLPITFPQVMAASMHIQLMSQKAFPLPLLGLVHVANRIEQNAPLSAGGEYDVSVRTGEAREARLGLEFDLITEFAAVGEAPSWKAVTSILYRNKSGGGRKKAGAPQPAVAFGHYAEVVADADIGRRYGKVSGDINPIHLTPWTAKLFGFKRAIAHGMWSLARSAALLQPQLGQNPTELTVEFKRPLFLPGRAALKFASEGEQMHFALIGSRGAETHLTGMLR